MSKNLSQTNNQAFSKLGNFVTLGSRDTNTSEREEKDSHN